MGFYLQARLTDDSTCEFEDMPRDDFNAWVYAHELSAAIEGLILDEDNRPIDEQIGDAFHTAADVKKIAASPNWRDTDEAKALRAFIEECARVGCGITSTC